ncbi:collagen-like protein [Peribacillus sp. NPDC101481]|uniref:collagen-like protein n=1 Tax=Peribacillus sp. NPDC101481 TaxID=3364403 RepID=UPI00380CB153
MYMYPTYHYEDQAFLERQFPGLSGFPGIPGMPQFPGQPGPPPGSQAPTAPPPAFIPHQQSASTFAVDPGAISFCLFRNTFIWLNNGASFWYYPIFVGPRSVAGFRWNGRFWTFFGIDTRQINSFSCF